MLVLLEMGISSMPWSTICSYVRTDKGHYGKRLLVLINLVDEEREKCSKLLDNEIFSNAELDNLIDKALTYSGGSRDSLAWCIQGCCFKRRR